MGPQCSRISRALDRHPDGVSRVDFLPPNVIDGGPPIVNFPGRIFDLIHKHHEAIEEAGERFGCKCFRRPVAAAPARPAPPVEATDPARPEPDVLQLFPLPVVNAITGDIAA
jgi:hypothetical protein